MNKKVEILNGTKIKNGNLDDFNNPDDPFGIADVSLEHPHGILGELMLEIDATSFRPIHRANILSALQILALVIGKKRGLYGNKCNFIGICLAPSSSGKGAGLKAVIDVATRLPQWKVFDSPRSDVDIIKNLIDGNGDSLYTVDEASRFFVSTSKTSGNQYTMNMVDIICNASTASQQPLSGNHERELKDKFRKEKNDLSKNIKAARKDEDRPMVLALEHELMEVERKLEVVSRGYIEHPRVNMIMFTTPSKAHLVVDADNVAGGLLGRTLLLKLGPLGAKRKRKDIRESISKNITARLARIATQNKSAPPVTFDTDAEAFFEDIEEYYDKPFYRDHPERQALYGRLGERVEVIASLLAAETGKVTIQDLRYTLKLTLEHISNVDRLRSKSEFGQNDDKIVLDCMDLVLDEIAKLAPNNRSAYSTIEQNIIHRRCKKKDHLHPRWKKAINKAVTELLKDQIEWKTLNGKPSKQLIFSK